MPSPQFFEGAMLICFGVSWPIAILKTLRTKRVEGKSLFFLLLVFAGYLAGITAKVLHARIASQPIELVTGLYGFNALLVAIDFMLVCKYRNQSPEQTTPDPIDGQP